MYEAGISILKSLPRIWISCTYENLFLIICKALKNLDKFCKKRETYYIAYNRAEKHGEPGIFSGIYFVEKSGNANEILLGLGEYFFKKFSLWSFCSYIVTSQVNCVFKICYQCISIFSYILNNKIPNMKYMFIILIFRYKIICK